LIVGLRNPDVILNPVPVKERQIHRHAAENIGKVKRRPRLVGTGSQRPAERNVRIPVFVFRLQLLESPFQPVLRRQQVRPVGQYRKRHVKLGRRAFLFQDVAERDFVHPARYVKNVLQAGHRFLKPGFEVKQFVFFRQQALFGLQIFHIVGFAACILLPGDFLNILIRFYVPPGQLD